MNEFLSCSCPTNGITERLWNTTGNEEGCSVGVDVRCRQCEVINVHGTEKGFVSVKKPTR